MACAMSLLYQHWILLLLFFGAGTFIFTDETPDMSLREEVLKDTPGQSHDRRQLGGASTSVLHLSKLEASLSMSNDSFDR